MGWPLGWLGRLPIGREGQEAAAGDQGRDAGLDRSGCCGWSRSESGRRGRGGRGGPEVKEEEPR